MTRRIVIAILLTTSVVLLLSDGITYGTIRALLLRDLDETIMARITLLPQVEASLATGVPVTTDARDRYVIKNDQGQSVGRRPVEGEPASDQTPQVMHAAFTTLADGSRYRTLTIRALARDADDGSVPAPLTIVYSGSAAHFDAMLRQLLAAMAAANILVAAATALVVRRVSISALRPLSVTAATIGSIDEKHLDRRIALEHLPRELLPMADRLNEMLARLEESVKRRNRFLSDASHELRAPLAAAMTGLEVCLRRPRTAEEYRQALQDCLQDTQSLRTLVESLMEQVKSERFEKEWEVQPVDVGALLRSCVRMAAVLAAPKEVRVEMKPATLLIVRTSEERLRSIVMNLLTNAVEYNRPGGTVDLAASCTAGHLKVAVHDTGVGIPPADLPRVAEPFYRVDKTRKPSASHHLGLGLSLVHSHIEALGGTCLMQSDLGQGTTVTIDVPVEVWLAPAEPHPAPLEPENLPLPVPAGEVKT